MTDENKKLTLLDLNSFGQISTKILDSPVRGVTSCEEYVVLVSTNNELFYFWQHMPEGHDSTNDFKGDKSTQVPTVFRKEFYIYADGYQQPNFHIVSMLTNQSCAVKTEYKILEIHASDKFIAVRSSKMVGIYKIPKAKIDEITGELLPI